jgi:glycylpeptide N-tetradecanoyltransferase
MTLARMITANKLPSSTPVLAGRGLREMEERDIPGVGDLWFKYMQRFKMHPEYSLPEVKHHLLSGRGSGELVNGRREGQVVWSYVVEVSENVLSHFIYIRSFLTTFSCRQDPKTQKITDFFTFYSLPSTVMQSQKHELLEAAYMYYYATDVAFQDNAESLGLLRRRLLDLIGDALIVADQVRYFALWRYPFHLNIPSQAKFDVFNALTLMDNALFLNELKVRVNANPVNSIPQRLARCSSGRAMDS